MMTTEDMKNADDDLVSQTTAALVLVLLCSLSGVALAMVFALILSAGK